MDDYRSTLVKQGIELESDIQFYKDKIKELKDFGITCSSQEANLAKLYENLWYKQSELSKITNKIIR